MGRKPCCEKVGLKRGPWTAEEDLKLVSYISSSGLGCWRAIPKLAGLLRCGKSCRLRWTNYLRPDLKRGIFTEEEEDTILGLHATLGNRWSRIAAQLPGRTDNEIKNYWNTRLKKRLRSQGLDPATHQLLGESGESDGDDDDEDLDDASGTPRRKKVKKMMELTKAPVRQPRGPKPAPQLKMCQSDDGPVLVKVPKAAAVVRSDDELSSTSSTVTTAEDRSYYNNKLARLPSYPEAELWKSIKPVLDEWADSSPGPVANPPPALLTNTYPKLELPHFRDAACDIFNAQLDDIWTMDSMCPPAPESLFVPMSSYMIPSREPIPPPGSPLHQSPELQRLAAILDLI